MNRMKQKLKSEYGASILLALLFFLICTLVTAVLLMAAASNAGKVRSNREVHQKYLAVSSALELVCEDLLSKEYCGQYDYWEEVIEHPSTDENGYDTTTYTYEYHYNQIKGQYNCELSELLLDELDRMFYAQMQTDVNGLTHTPSGTIHLGTYLGTPELLEHKTHIITVTPELEGEELTAQEVVVTIKLDDSYTVNLFARLKEDDGQEAAAYAMEAELTPTTLPRIETRPTENGTHQSSPLKWRLGWITKASEGTK